MAPVAESGSRGAGRGAWSGVGVPDSLAGSPTSHCFGQVVCGPRCYVQAPAPSMPVFGQEAFWG